MKLKLKEGWCAVENTGKHIVSPVRYWGKTANMYQFTAAQWADGSVVVSPNHDGEHVWTCTDVENAHRSLTASGCDSPWDVVCD